MFDLPLEHLSYLGIVVLLVLTGSGLPVPEEVIIIFAGVQSADGALNPWLALAACLLGALVGDCVMYGIGRYFGRNVIREHPWFARFMTPEREQRMEAMIQRHGLKVFLLARFMVGLRSPVYLTAGILRVPLRRFMLVDVFCASLVIGTFFGLSFLFADHIQTWWNWIRHTEMALSGLIVAAILGVLGYLFYQHRRRLARIRWLHNQRNLLQGRPRKKRTGGSSSAA